MRSIRKDSKMKLNPRYVSPQVFHRYLKEELGIKIGINAVYQGLQEGSIRSIRVHHGAFQVPVEELEAYPERLLEISRGVPSTNGLLGTPKKVLDG
jgi:hypothetical protein